MGCNSSILKNACQDTLDQTVRFPVLILLMVTNVKKYVTAQTKYVIFLQDAHY